MARLTGTVRRSVVPDIERSTTHCHAAIRGSVKLARATWLTRSTAAGHSDSRMIDPRQARSAHRRSRRAHVRAGRGSPRVTQPSGPSDDGSRGCRRIVRDTPRQARSPSATVVRPGLGLTTSPLLQRASPSVGTRGRHGRSVKQRRALRPGPGRPRAASHARPLAHSSPRSRPLAQGSVPHHSAYCEPLINVGTSH
jgi:hypothetical protein